MNGLYSSPLEAFVPKSILKKSPPAPPSPPHPTTREEHNRELALHHANLIQQRKDVEASIFSSLEALIDFPTHPNADPADPSPTDAAHVRSTLKQFQPSDFDSLIEERNLEGKCGYVLCPRLRRLENTRARFRILKGIDHGRHELRVVQTGQLEKWCSDDCGRRGLYLRVQLSQQPAWERTSSMGGDLDLYGEDDTIGRGASREDLDTLTNSLRQLAIERGDMQSGGKHPHAVAVKIQEQEAQKPPKAPTFSHDAMHIDIEGYAPSRDRARLSTAVNHEDIMDTI